MLIARHGAIELAYETSGAADAEPLLLISGTGVQMLMWPDAFVAALAGRGFCVTRFDNRDAGLSTHLTQAGNPGWFKPLIRRDFRQRAAVSASGSRRKALAGVRIPTLVLHGGQDPVINVKAGRATAAAIPGARLVIYPDMGHDLPQELWPSMLDEIAALAARAPGTGPR
jgi:pimeloyl-ACP methyl ester carboxylesterase